MLCRCLLFVVCYVLRVALHRLAHVVRCSLFVVRCSLCVVRGSCVFLVCGSLCIVHWLLFTSVRCVLHVVCCLYLFVLIVLVVCRGLRFAL